MPRAIYFQQTITYVTKKQQKYIQYAPNGLKNVQGPHKDVPTTYIGEPGATQGATQSGHGDTTGSQGSPKIAQKAPQNIPCVDPRDGYPKSIKINTLKSSKIYDVL